MQQVALVTSCSCFVSKSRTRYAHQPKGWSTNRTVTVWQTIQVLSDKLTSRCVTSYLSALVTSKTNSYATSRFSYKLQLLCQQVKDALCHQPKGWSTNRTVTVWQTMQVLSDKLTSRCVTSYLSALVTSETNSYATSRFNYKLQLRCQQVLDALCHQPKGWSTNRTVTVWQTIQVLSDKLTSRCVTSYLSALVTSKTNSYATSRSLTSCSCVVSKSWTRYVINQRATAWQAMGWLRHTQNSHCVTNYAGTIWQTN